MMLEEQVSIDRIEVAENGIVIYREATSILKNGVVVSKTYHRTSLTPGQDLTGVPQNVQNICAVVWTPDTVAAYKASQDTAP